MKQKKIFLMLFLVLVNIFIFTGIAYATNDYYTQTNNSTISSNASSNNYITYGTTVKSYLYTGPDGNLVRVEYLASTGILVEKYNSAFSCIDKKTIPMELSIFGGFYSGSNYNFLVFGQNNLEDDDSVEVIRVVKYSKDWNRIDSLSLNAINTYIPFDAGSCRMTEKNGVLFIDTCHEMYASAKDGLHHQANLYIKVNQSDMKLQFCRYGVSNIGTGYVSHSFNEFIEEDENYIYTADHGDAYPRGIVVCKIPVNGTTPDSYATVLPIQGATGANSTGVSIGGLAVSSSNVFIVGNSVDQSSSETYSASGTRNIFFTTTSKNSISSSSTNIKWLTNYSSTDNVTVKTPQIVKVNNNKFLIMWEEYKNGAYGTIKGVLIDGNGNNLSSIISFGGRLSDCQPIIHNNKVTWYVGMSSKMPIIFTLDVSSVSNFEKYNNQNIISNVGNLFEHFTCTSSSTNITITEFDGKITNVDMTSFPEKVPAWYSLIMGSSLFKDCTNLESVKLYDGITTIPSSTFENCTNLKTFTIPSTVKTISSRAFYGCTAIKNFTVPNTVTSISDNIFEGCTNLESVQLSNQVTSVSRRMFYGCTSLKNVIIPDSVTIIYSRAFANCTSLKNINIPENVTSIESYAFYESGLTGTITIPKKVNNIGSYSFYLRTNGKIDKFIVENPDAAIRSNAFSISITKGVGEKFSILEASQITSCRVSSSSLATVTNQGLISVIGKGYGSIYYSDADENTIATVSLTAIQYVENISLSDTKLDMKIDDTKLLKVTYSPSSANTKSVTWKSSDSNIVIVDENGNVKALKEGTCTITATTTDGKNVSASCIITVSKKEEPIKPIEPTKSYTVIFKDYDGKILNTQTVEQGKNAVPPSNPIRDGYEFIGWDKNFNNITSNLEVIAQYKKNEEEPKPPVDELPFTDIKENAFYMNALKDLYKKGYVTGTTKTTFSPNANLSRAMLVTILWNMENRPKVDGVNKFSDVKNGVWYTDAIVWASTNGVVNGNKDGTFAPNNNITRQEVAVMLCNYAKYKGKDVTSNKDLSTFKDISKVASWAMPAMRWAIENRVIGGAENGTKINPVNNATRGEAVTMIKNYIDNIK